jgi:hypothetical protein
MDVLPSLALTMAVGDLARAWDGKKLPGENATLQSTIAVY